MPKPAHQNRWIDWQAIMTFCGNRNPSLFSHSIIGISPQTSSSITPISSQPIWLSILVRRILSISTTPSFYSFTPPFLVYFTSYLPLYSGFVLDRLIYYVSTTLNTGGDSPICRKFLRFDAHFGITGYGCSGLETEDRYQPVSMVELWFQS